MTCFGARDGWGVGLVGHGSSAGLVGVGSVVRQCVSCWQRYGVVLHIGSVWRSRVFRVLYSDRWIAMNVFQSDRP